MAKKTSDPWSPKERKLKNKTEKLKEILLKPIVAPLIYFGITANMISFISAILGVVAAVYVLIDLNIALVLLIISLLCDGIDGTVARKTKSNNAKGAITDCFFDQITIIATSMTFAVIGILSPALAVLYSTLYAVLVIFTVIRNRLNIPNGYVLRPRLIVYGFFALYVLTQINLLNEVVLVVSVILAGYTINGFLKLRGKL